MFLLAGPFHSQAHRLDDLLQAALIEITAGEVRIQVNLNPGADIAERVIWMIDRNGDRLVSRPERNAYAKAMAQSLKFSIDDRPVGLTFVSVDCDPVHQLRSGNGMMHIEMRGRIPALHEGTHRCLFENRHLPEISAYLVNAVFPKDPTIKILKQTRNENQSVGSIEFEVVRK